MQRSTLGPRRIARPLALLQGLSFLEPMESLATRGSFPQELGSGPQVLVRGEGLEWVVSTTALVCVSASSQDSQKT